MKYNIIDLFCGAGGFSKGMERAGFKSVLGVDFWYDAIQTYNRNHKGNGLVKSVIDFTDKELLEIKNKFKVTGIIGGPPCQGFSMVGTRKETDARNSLYLQYVRFVNFIQPDFFVLENVKGLLSLEKGFFKKDIVDRFTACGYNTNFKVLKASEYGLPQNRERVFFIGLNNNKFNDDFFNWDTVKKSKNQLGTKDAIGDIPPLHKDSPVNRTYSIKPQNAFQNEMRKKMDNKEIKNHEITNHTDQTIHIISQVPDGGSIKDIDEKYYSVRNYNTAFKRMNSKLPSTTIDCGHRNYFHYEQNRVPSVREAARLQTFPDHFIFEGSKTSQYKQVGNAVPPMLATILGIEIKKKLKNIVKT